MKVSKLVEGLTVDSGRRLSVGWALSDIRRLERIEEAAEKLVRNRENGTPHPIDYARLREAVEYPKRRTA